MVLLLGRNLMIFSLWAHSKIYLLYYYPPTIVQMHSIEVQTHMQKFSSNHVNMCKGIINCIAVM
jgi:hypothetical protein